MTKTRFLNWEKPGKAVVTGASSGIGAEFARKLAELGFTPVLVARRKEKLEKIAKEVKKNFNAPAEVAVVDLSDLEQVHAFAASLKEDSTVDILINNAGFGLSEGFGRGKLEPHLNMMRVHMEAPVILTHAVIPNMIENGRGAIVNTASIAAFNPGPGLYPPTKAFLVTFSEGLSIELEGTGIRVQALCPGFTHTEFHEDPGLATLKTNTPKFAWGNVEDVVSASISGLKKNKKIVIPGFINKLVCRVPKSLRAGVVAKRVRREVY